MAVVVGRRIEVEGVVIAAEVIFWPGWSSTDMKTNPPLLVSHRMSVSTFVMSAAS